MPHLTAVGQGIATTLAALAGGAMLRWVGFDRTLSRLHDALALVLVGAAASPLISATLGVAALYAGGVQNYSGIASGWFIYWFGDGTGVIWNIDPASWKRQACRVANRNLTPAEWHDFLPQRSYRQVCP